MPSSKLNKKPRPKLDTAISHRLEFEAIGTTWQISLETDQSAAIVARLERQIRRRIAIFDKHYSRFRDDSLVAQMARQPGEYELPADAEPLLDLYRQLYERTNGRVTPLIGQALSDAGYDKDYSLRPKTLHPSPAWDTVLAYKFPKLMLKQPALLDFGAAGKGYLVDLVAEIISTAGIHEFCINAGGDILQRSVSETPYAVGLEHPANPQQAVGIAQITNQSICGSAGNRRAWGDYTHLLDPETQTSPRQLLAAWVIADSALLADGLTTALFFMPAAALSEHYNFEYALLAPDYSLQTSSDFPAEFFITERVRVTA